MLGFASRTALSLGLFGVYVMGLGLTLVTIPDVPLSAGGLPPHEDVWIRVAGMMIFIMGAVELLAGRTNWVPFAQMSVPLRYAVICFFTAFVVMGEAGPALIPFGLADSIGATWTLWALWADSKEASRSSHGPV